MRFLSALMPRERQFFALFDQHAGIVVRSSKSLEQLLAIMRAGADMILTYLTREIAEARA